MPCVEAKLIDRVAQRRRHLAGVNHVNPRPIARLSVGRVAFEIGVMRLIAMDLGKVLLLQVSLAVDLEMCAQLRVFKYAAVRNRVATSLAF
ncbi:unnamed protein product [Heligmosomoides polygyrus]|uniref:Uncharacterized protein n=1 Tax=Heligmosomoides polygyrus TaxID=6339 RepID=A0A183GLY5_HELPZ|nr:unnamed protein product [Heligmosomoides polygyrus]